ncbi:hypothetical protein PS3A_60790 [Pseudomonas sp. 3A(2025)]
MDRAQQQSSDRQEMTGIERLMLRVSEMINSPQAQLRRSAVIHRLDTDTDQAWERVMELLLETDGLEMTFNDDGTVLLTWHAPTEADRVIDENDLQAAPDVAPF